ncbi:MAG TPA: acylase [Solibacterales bacterium]|nr:acylase [Bryobacterales bacterium]
MRCLFTFLLTAVSLCAAPYRVEIRRTSHGIPHITARDFGSLGFGEGYAQAEDHVCTIADQVVRARGERARYFGRGANDQHLLSDLGLKALRTLERGAEDLAKEAPEIREMLAGFAAGYNHYLEQTGRARLPSWCRDAEWVKPITAEELAATRRLFVSQLSFLAREIGATQPPGEAGPRSAERPTAEPAAGASNGWGIGRDLAASRRGMLLANPHYPWVGSNRFWEKHLVIPGQLDVYGANVVGGAGVAIGFNKDVAWTHTVSAGTRMVYYAVDLVPGKPTSYLFDGTERAMTPRTVSVDVKRTDGTLETVTRTYWFTHHGPVVNLGRTAWSARRALCAKDANENNNHAARQWLAMARARSMKEFQAAHATYQGMPWVNTISTSREGIAWYADTSSTPNLSEEAWKAWEAWRGGDEWAKGMFERGQYLFPGSDSKFEWAAAEGAREPGLVPFARMPQLARTDYVFNANDSYWMANSKALLEGTYSPLHGRLGARSLRTRNNDLTLSNLSPDRPAGGDGRFTLDELASAILSNRSHAAELVLPELLERCQAKPVVMLDSQEIDLSTACAVLGKWNGRYDLDSRGAMLFREYFLSYSGADATTGTRLFSAPFDKADPVRTPRQLASGELALTHLARAVRLLTSLKIALDTPLGDVQYANKPGQRIPIHGGHGLEGVMNMMVPARNETTLEPTESLPPVKGSVWLTAKGYPVTHGSSFLMVLEYTAAGPAAKAFLTYGQSGDPESPHFRDQTELFSKKQWRPVLFREAEIRKDVKSTVRLEKK